MILTTNTHNAIFSIINDIKINWIANDDTIIFNSKFNDKLDIKLIFSNYLNTMKTIILTIKNMK